MKLIHFGLAALFSMGVGTGFAQQILTPGGAVQMGLKNNFAIRIARNNSTVAQNSRQLGRAAFFPVLDVTGSIDGSTSDLTTNNPFRPGGRSDTQTGNAQVALNWTLFDGFRMFATRQRFDALAEAGEWQTRSEIESKVLEVLQAYFNLVQQRQLLAVARQTRAVSETRFSREKTRRELGSVSSTDLLNAQVAFNNDVAAFLDQELQVTIAQKNLNRLLVFPVDTLVAVEDEISVAPLDLTYEEVRNLVRTRNSDLLAAMQSRLAAEQDLKITRSSFLPRLILGANYGYTDQSISAGTENPAFPEKINNTSTDGRVNLILSFNLFNGFQDKTNYQNARLALQNRQLALQDLQEELLGLAYENYQALQTQLQLISLQEENLKAARQNLQLQEDRYAVGTATSLEFRDAQLNLARTQAAVIAARFQAKMTRLRLEKLVGRIQISER